MTKWLDTITNKSDKAKAFYVSVEILSLMLSDTYRNNLSTFQGRSLMKHYFSQRVTLQTFVAEAILVHTGPQNCCLHYSLRPTLMGKWGPVWKMLRLPLKPINNVVLHG